MPSAPFSLYIDLPKLSTLTVSAGTATLTTASAHGLVVGDYIQLEGVATTTAWNKVWQVSGAPNGTQVTFAAGTVTGTAELTDAVGARDLFNPLSNYGESYRSNAPIVPLGSVTMSKAGDGGGASFGFTVLQDVTPATGPWWTNIPDNARVRLIKCASGTTPAANESDVQFKGIVGNVSAGLNGGGQGSICQITVDDVNIILDRVTVNGDASARNINTITAFNRKLTITTYTTHRFKAGDTVAVSGVLFQHTNSDKATKSPINRVNLTVESVATNKVQLVTNALSAAAFPDGGHTLGRLTISSVTATTPTAVKNSKNLLTIYPGNNVFHNLTNADVGMMVYFTQGNGGTGAIWTWMQESVFRINKIISENAGGGIIIEAINARPRPSGGSVTLATMRSYDLKVDLVPPVEPGQYALKDSMTEQEIVQNFFTVGLQTSYDYDSTLKRLFDINDTSGVAALTGKLPETVLIEADTFQSALDTVVENFSGVDGLERRFWLANDRKLNYKVTSGTASVPTYANAPLKIITAGAGDPYASPGTIAADQLVIDYRHSDIIKRVVVYPKTGKKTLKVYNEVGYAERSGPLLEARLDASLVGSSSGVDRAAKAFFMENHKPILSGSFTLRGYGTASFNEYGWQGGIYQTGAATYATATSWEPGQYVSIVAPSLSLDGLYRVETVDVVFEDSSFAQAITIGFSRRPVGTLSDIVRKRGR